MSRKLSLKINARKTIVGVVTGKIEIALIKKAKKDGARIIELRLDTLKDRGEEDLKEKLEKIRKVGLPLILTIRSTKEGGEKIITDKERLSLFSALIPFVDFIDIELSSKKILKLVTSLARKEKKQIIISHHDFNKTPGLKKLEGIIKNAIDSGASIVKIATFARSSEDIKRLSTLLSNYKNKKALALIAMGRAGQVSRVFFPFLGSALTFGSITKSTAPGQLTLKELATEIKKYD
ncbi:MAG: type I 3-dehydroquinate dehydratase [Deltaproteobacteria bacterium]|nr:type I 3-dehydroquinate dehydratase [Deltaproteobacteria bacterium]